MKQRSSIQQEILPLVWAVLGFGMTTLYWDRLSEAWSYPKGLLLGGIVLWGMCSWVLAVVIWGRTRRLYAPWAVLIGLAVVAVQVAVFEIAASGSFLSLSLGMMLLWIAFIWRMSTPQAMHRLRWLYWGIEVGVSISAIYTLGIALGGARLVTPLWNILGVSQVPETLVGADLGTQILCSAVILVSSLAQMIYAVYDTSLPKQVRPLTTLFYLGTGVVNASFLFAFWGQEGAVIPALSVILTLGAMAVLYLKPGLIVRKQKLRLSGWFTLVIISALVSLLIFSGARSVFVAEDTRLIQEVIPAVDVLIQDHLPLGRGIGQANRNIGVISEGRVLDISNAYIQWFVETGLLGLLALGAIILLVLRMIVRAYAKQTLYDDPFYIASILGLFQLAILGIFVSFHTVLLLVGSVYLARIFQHSIKEHPPRTLQLMRLNPQGQIAAVLLGIVGCALLVWGGLFVGRTVYADILWNTSRIEDTSSDEYLEQLETVLDYNPRHISASEQYITLRLAELQELEDDPAALEQAVLDILGTTQNLVQAYPEWYLIQLFEAQVLLELSTQVLLPDFWFEDRLAALQALAPESAQTLVMEARFILVRVAAESQNAQLYQGLNPLEEEAEPEALEDEAKIERVVALLESATEINPALPDLWIARVFYLEQIGNREEISLVLEEYVTYVAENQLPANPELVLLLVQEYIDQGRFAEAEQYLQQVQRAYPDLNSAGILQESLESAQ